MKHTLKQAILNYEKKKKPRCFVKEIAELRARVNALTFYAISSTATFIILAIIYS